MCLLSFATFVFARLCQVKHYSLGSVYQYSRSTNKLAAIISITDLPVATSALISYTIVYNGCAGKEYAVYDYTNRRVYFINRTNGAYVATAQLPSTAPQPTSFGIAYSNQMFWVFSAAKLIWYSYNVLTGNVLPLTLTNISAKKQGNTATVYWTSMNEVNVDKFVIERSTDAIHFEEIASLQAIGTGNNNYQATDVSLPHSWVAYYRLKIYEKNGSFTYSQLATVTLTNQPQLFYISPNPAIAFATLTFSHPVQQGTVAVYNSTGNRVIFKTITNQSSIYKLAVQNLPAGIYAVKVICADGVYQQKLMINK